MSRQRTLAAAVMLVAAVATPARAPAVHAGLPALQHLRPGQPADVHQHVPVTVVFVGLEAGAGATGIDVPRLLGSQLAKNRVIDRTTRYYAD